MFIQSLPIYNSNVWDSKYYQMEALKESGSFDEWFAFSFGVNPRNIEEIRLSYWDEIKIIPHFWEMLDEIVNQNKESILEKLKNNEDFHVDQLFADKHYADLYEKNSIIRHYINLELTPKYKTLLFEKFNIILTIFEKLENNNEELEYDEQKEFMEANYVELNSFYDDIHERFYNQFLN